LEETEKAEPQQDRSQGQSLTRNPQDLFTNLRDYIYGAVDMLASEYGWTDDYILRHVYPFQIPLYKARILQRQTAHYKMLLAIEHNPHQQDPKKLYSALENTGDRAGGRDYIDKKLDKQGFAMLKRQVATARATRK